ncbi:Unannotated [Lentimonas sp. CC19]|nr:Unannotated [Lentimonas sp. CC19]CAA6694533.1 Unannotated [Lentimonas sp. CC10]CAA7071870.1 Unannotated [Lentimonas sp. CC11]
MNYQFHKARIKENIMKTIIAIACFISVSVVSHAAPLVLLSGEMTPEASSTNLAVSIAGNTGSNSANTSTTTGYWTSASETTNSTSNESIHNAITLTVSGLADTEVIALTHIAFDYVRLTLNGSTPILDLYIDTGDGYGDSILTVNDDPTGANQTDAISFPTHLTLQNGDSITFGFSFADAHGLESRTHLIDNFTLSGTTYSTVENLGIRFAELSGEATPDYVDELLDVSITGNTGYNADARGSDFVAYWTSSDATSSDPSNTDIHNAFTFTATGLTGEESIDLTALRFDFTRLQLNSSNPQMNIYLNTGDGYGDPIYVFTNSTTLTDQTDLVSLNTTITLTNGESATFGFSFGDVRGGTNRTHFIDNLILYGSYDLDSGTDRVDLNNNGVGDIWEYRFNATELVSDAATKAQDYDGDGISNIDESIAGTDPFDALSRLDLKIKHDETEGLMLSLPTQRGKGYTIFGGNRLSPEDWDPENLQFEGSGNEMDFSITSNDDTYFFQAVVDDIDTDEDRVSRWEELQLAGFTDDDATSGDDENITDFDRLKSIAQAALQSSLTISTDQHVLYELENIPATVTFTRYSTRSDDLLNLERAETFQITDTTKVASNAASASDYFLTDTNGSPLTNGLLTMPAGVASVQISIHPIADGVIESDEQLTLTVGDANLNLWISDAETMPSADYIAISQAGHFLSQASMGGTPEIISALANEIRDNGYLTACEAWIDDQLTLPRESTITQDCYDHQLTFLEGNSVPSINIQNFEFVWWGKMIQTNEQLRHRVAFSLSQVFVTSSAFWANQERNNVWESYTSYYDSLMDLAYSTHRDLLESISYDPFMGVYLSSAQNRKEDVSLGTYPDENYAREVMQLFSCGVYSQDQYGEYLLDANDDRIENYDNDDIKELAQVFTGLSLTSSEGVGADFDSPRSNLGSRYQFPMIMVDSYHDTSSKVLLDGTVLAAGQSGEQDISDVLDRLAVHPSTAPHLSRLLIKRFTNSNPTSAYIGRVTEAWRGEGTYGNGEIGNFVSVIKAILLDPEARLGVDYAVDETTGAITATPTLATAGRIKEPILKWTQFYRFAQALSGDEDGLIRVQAKTKQAANDQTPDFGQIPMRAPSVFNYYDSDHSPSVGDLAEAEITYGLHLTSPESEILTPYIINQFESFYEIVNADEPVSFSSYNSYVFSIDYSYLGYLYRKNQEVAGFIDDVNLWLCNGQISPELKGKLVTIANANGAGSRENFTKILSILFNSSDFSVAY